MMSEIDRTLDELSADDTHISDVRSNLSLDEQERQEHIRGLRQDIDERKHYANHIFWFLVSYMGIVLVILFCNGFTIIPFCLSESIIIALITTTTANILTVFYFVVRYLFYTKP